MVAFKKELAAEVLLTAIFTTDAEACEKYGVSLRSLRRWRQQLAAGDPELAAFVHTKKAVFDAAWAERLSPALSRGLQALDKCFAEIMTDPRLCKNPVIIHALAGAVHILADVDLSNRVIDSRLG